MKFKRSLTLILLVSVLQTQASNPLTYLCEKSIPGVSSIGDGGSVGTIANYGWKVVKGNGSLNTYIRNGVFNNAAYVRILLSEFYCGRCAIASGAFANNKLAPQTDWPSNTQIGYGNVQSGNMQPGGFIENTVNDFYNTAKSSSGDLKDVRLKIEQNSNFYYEGSGPPINPLDNFAGVFLVPDSAFIEKYGAHLALENEGYINRMMFLKPTKTSETSTNPIFGKTITVSYSGYSSEEINGKSSVNVIDLTLTSYSSKFGQYTPSSSTQLYSITGSAVGLSSKTIIQGYTGEPNSGNKIGTFFRHAPNNRWALVVSVSYSNKTNKISYSVPGMIQLNPLDYPPNNASNINLLMNSPQKLYGMTSNPKNVEGISTARMLRGLANGYLTSWSYKQLVKPANFLMPNSSPNQGSIYPTPSTKAFASSVDHRMLYALYSTRQALTTMHLRKEGIPYIEDIIKDPSKATKGYIGSTPGKTYQTVFLFPSTNTPTTQSKIVAPKHTHNIFTTKKIKKFITKLTQPLNIIKNFLLPSNRS
jgi:hypothetical protein